ncbi:MAG: hypothetical protein IJ702_06800, partial [Fretibacterium sp.]|nr:hypothetical protein [Fretibacterium sp.]
MKRRKNTSKNTSWNALILSFCLAAAWLCLLYTALSRGEEPPLPPVPQGREATALPEAAQPLLAHPEPAQLLAEVAEV